MELSVPAGTDSALFETLLTEYNADYAAHCRIETAPYPGVAALLLKLHAQGRKLAIVSNKPDEAVRALRADFFADAVPIAVGETAAIRRKPAPDMLGPPWKSSVPTLTRRSLSAIPRSTLPRRARQICRVSACCGAFVTGTCSSAPVRSSLLPTPVSLQDCSTERKHPPICGSVVGYFLNFHGMSKNFPRQNHAQLI